MEEHSAGIEKEYYHLEKLTNLDKLPAFGFTVSCLPVKIKNASAAWTRTVAIIPYWKRNKENENEYIE